MDSITQAALGAAIGKASLGKYIGNKSMVIGVVVATIPDLDIALYLIYNKFEMLSIHRGYSHSILVSLIGSVLLSLLFKRIKWTKEIHLFKLLLFNWLALFTHTILDAFTAYGTQLFLPFSDCRFGLDSINVVDSIYTIPLLLGLSGSILFKKKKFNTIGLIVSTGYLIGTLAVKGIINDRLENDLADQQIEYYDFLTIPVGTASLNWYGLAKNDENLYLKKYSLYKENDSEFHSFKINDRYLNKLSPIQKERMIWFAKGFYTVEMDEDTIFIYNLQVDMRGVVKNDSIYAPTQGYFKFMPNKDGSYNYW